MSVIEYFRLKKDEAKAIIDSVQAAVSNWKKLADSLKISKAEQERMETAFVL